MAMGETMIYARCRTPSGPQSGPYKDGDAVRDDHPPPPPEEVGRPTRADVHIEVTDRPVVADDRRSHEGGHRVGTQQHRR